MTGAIREIATSDRAVLVHCAAGKDRTGVVVAIALDAVGVKRELIAADYLVTNRRIEAILARLQSSPTYREGLEGRSPPTRPPSPGRSSGTMDFEEFRATASADIPAPDRLDVVSK